MLNAHFACGDGRCNENIALTTIHQIFHSEHNRLVDDIKNVARRPTPRRPASRRSPQWQAADAPQTARRLRLRRAAVPGRPLRHRDGVPAPGVRGVRPQGAAGDPAVPRLLAGHQPGDPGRVRARRLPLRALDARRRRRPHERRPGHRCQDRQLAAAADGVPEPAGVLQRRHGRARCTAAAGGRQRSSWARRTRPATSSTSS